MASPDGSYTVKTAYHMLASEVLHSSPSSFGGMAGNVWKGIWKIKTPQKIKHFIWRAAKGSLPTKQNLSVFRSFLDLFEAVLELGFAFNVAVFATTTWSLWQFRNRLCEHQPTWPLYEVPSPVSQSPWAGWSPPPEGVYKANFDAALFKHCNYAELGVVVRDCNGDVIAALSQRIALPHSVEHAEALAVSRAVTLAKELCLSQMVFEGDCQREGNKIAHALARRAVLTADIDVWVEKLPNDVGDVFHSKIIQ
ncbi:uncharacterized protein LOC126728284 [Quercus robur]|uniref:uncharacterized protein LOC126728284 n=1 Tax=Quercus robur TaxID=38942 RepID=UPI002163685F|nr:uncharacterized protein LOC126728284 [Quercus robur]